MEVCKELSRKFDPLLNKSARALCKNWLLEALTEGDPYELNRVERMALEKAIKFCKALAFNVDDYPILVSEHLGDSVLGRAHNEKIYLSKRIFMMGTKQVAVTLIEEWLHLKHNLVDETYAMQNFLFDTIASLGEQLLGEPL